MSDAGPQRSAARRGGRPTAEQAARLDRAVHECALELFLAHGYEGTSMEAVAAAAGTTKASLYARYAGKEAMFRAVLSWVAERQDWPVPEPEADGLDLDRIDGLPALEAVLREVARSAVRRALHPQMVQLTRLAVAHAEHFPRLAEQSNLSPWRRYDRLVDVLRRLQLEGVIDPDADAELLAENFFAMVSGMPARLALLGVVRPAEEQRTRTDAAVRLFVNALRP